MSQNSLIQVRVDDTMKKEADELFASLGFDTPTAIRIFLRQAIDLQGLPFEVVRHVPNAATIAALREAEQISQDSSAKRYPNFTELLKEVEEDA